MAGFSKQSNLAFIKYNMQTKMLCGVDLYLCFGMVLLIWSGTQFQQALGKPGMNESDAVFPSLQCLKDCLCRATWSSSKSHCMPFRSVHKAAKAVQW